MHYKCSKFYFFVDFDAEIRAECAIQHVVDRVPAVQSGVYRCPDGLIRGFKLLPDTLRGEKR